MAFINKGSLRDQIIYPDSLEDMRKKRLTDEDLMRIMEIVNLQQVVIREGGEQCRIVI